MTYTPEQLTSLNRAIAEHEGYDYDKEFFDWQHLSGVGGAAFHLNYTTSLDAIVEVVREWLLQGEEKVTYMLSTNRELRRNQINFALPSPSNVAGFISEANPALALCLAFAKAAGLKGEMG